MPGGTWQVSVEPPELTVTEPPATEVTVPRTSVRPLPAGGSTLTAPCSSSASMLLTTHAPPTKRQWSSTVRPASAARSMPGGTWQVSVEGPA